MKINSEAILDSLIESGHIYLGKIDSDVVYDAKTACILCIRHQLDFIDHSGSFLVLQRALFEECKNTELEFFLWGGLLSIYMPVGFFGKDTIHEGDTSRESFILAYQKVVGIE